MNSSLHLDSILYKRRTIVSLRNQARLAIKHKDIKKFRLLVAIYGVHKLLKGDDGISLLRFAISCNATNIAKFLIRNVVDLNKIKSNSFFPSLLNLTVEKNNQEMLNALLNNETDLCDVSMHLSSPLDYTLKSDHESIPQQLALGKCCSETYEALSKERFDVIIKDKCVNTIIYKAIESYCPRIVNRVLLLVQTVNKDYGEKCFNFLFANMKKDKQALIRDKESFCLIVSDLLRWGARVSEKAINPSNFMFALKAVSSDLVQYFIDAGMVPNSDVKSGEITYAFSCCPEKCTKIAWQLMKRDTHPDNLHTFLYALSRDNLKIIKAFLENGFRVEMNYLFHLALKSSATAVVEYLFSLGREYNLRDRKCLLRTAILNDHKLVALLINLGAPLDIRDVDGNTPLHLASLSRNVKTIETFIKSGVDVTLKNRMGQTALQFVMGKSRIPGPLMCHIIVLKLTKQPVEKEDFVVSTKCVTNRKYMDKCTAELEKVKKIKICNNSSHTYYDFATADVVKAARFLQNPGILNVLSTLDFFEIFPLCGYLMVQKFKLAYERILLHNKGVEKLQEIFKELGILPLEMIHCICWYLDAKDLQFLCGISS